MKSANRLQLPVSPLAFTFVQMRRQRETILSRVEIHRNSHIMKKCNLKCGEPWSLTPLRDMPFSHISRDCRCVIFCYLYIHTCKQKNNFELIFLPFICPLFTCIFTCIFHVDVELFIRSDIFSSIFIPDLFPLFSLSDWLNVCQNTHSCVGLSCRRHVCWLYLYLAISSWQDKFILDLSDIACICTSQYACL